MLGYLHVYLSINLLVNYFFIIFAFVLIIYFMKKIIKFLGFNYFIVPSAMRKVIHIDDFMDGRCNIRGKLKRIHYMAAMTLIRFRGYKLCKVCLKNSVHHV